MWSQGFSQSAGGIRSHGAATSKSAAHGVLPCTVSQLLTVKTDTNGRCTIGGCELHQVSIVGIIRGLSFFETNTLYAVDDMTGPPLNVRQWVNEEEGCAQITPSPGMYVKVTGTVRAFGGETSVQAMNIRCIKDLNEITSHMLEVVYAHMRLFGKVYDVNMNTTLASRPGECRGGYPTGCSLGGFSTIQDQVLHVIRTSHGSVSLEDLQRQLSHISMANIRSTLAFLLSEGHIFSTIDDHHFQSTESY